MVSLKIALIVAYLLVLAILLAMLAMLVVALLLLLVAQISLILVKYHCFGPKQGILRAKLIHEFGPKNRELWPKTMKKHQKTPKMTGF